MPWPAEHGKQYCSTIHKWISTSLWNVIWLVAVLCFANIYRSQKSMLFTVVVYMTLIISLHHFKSLTWWNLINTVNLNYMQCVFDVSNTDMLERQQKSLLWPTIPIIACSCGDDTQITGTHYSYRWQLLTLVNTKLRPDLVEWKSW